MRQAAGVAELIAIGIDDRVTPRHLASERCRIPIGHREICVGPFPNRDIDQVRPKGSQLRRVGHHIDIAVARPAEHAKAGPPHHTGNCRGANDRTGALLRCLLVPAPGDDLERPAVTREDVTDHRRGHVDAAKQVIDRVIIRRQGVQVVGRPDDHRDFWEIP